MVLHLLISSVNIYLSEQLFFTLLEEIKRTLQPHGLSILLFLPFITNASLEGWQHILLQGSKNTKKANFRK